MALAERPAHAPGIALTVLLAALLGCTLAQVSHEATHAVVALAVRARLEAFQLFGVDHQPPSGRPLGAWLELLIAGSAAPVNILAAGLCLLAFPRLHRRPSLRLLVFYYGAYSLFLGFGYLLVDPLFATAESPGDWARVVALLGGSWAVRLPIALVGGAGTVFGYFWMGRAAQHFRWGDPADPRARRRRGLVLCILPYVVVNLLFSVLALNHPLGAVGTAAMLSQYWLGYSGFFWAYMIKFHWSPADDPLMTPTDVPRRPDLAWVGAALFLVVVLIAVLLPGLRLGWEL